MSELKVLARKREDASCNEKDVTVGGGFKAEALWECHL
jgi:hypothetical protein